MGKGETAHYKQFLAFPQCFQQTLLQTIKGRACLGKLRLCWFSLQEQDFDDSFLPDISIKPGSEPTTPNGTLCACEACTERR